MSHKELNRPLPDHLGQVSHNCLQTVHKGSVSPTTPSNFIGRRESMRKMMTTSHSSPFSPDLLLPRLKSESTSVSTQMCFVSPLPCTIWVRINGGASVDGDFGSKRLVLEPDSQFKSNSKAHQLCILDQSSLTLHACFLNYQIRMIIWVPTS